VGYLNTKWFKSIPSHFLLILIFIFAVGPLILLGVNTFKPADEFLVNPFALPSRMTFENLINAWNEGDYGRAYFNSLLVGAATIAIVCFCGGLGAYTLAKIKFRGSNLVMLFLLLTLSVPMGLFLVPLFYIWQKLHLMNSLVGLIIIYSAIFLPFNVFLLRAFFIGIPKEINESAELDGCSEFAIYWRIMMPIARSSFLTVALIVGLWTWNEFFFANAFIQDDTIKTVSVRFLSFQGQFSSDWSKISAAGLISILPMVIAYLFLQRRFIEGITEGSIKG
jgi:raffinose/stachyose/melibiose transport system permease protein